jgi:hypothetical protein
MKRAAPGDPRGEVGEGVKAQIAKLPDAGGLGLDMQVAERLWAGNTLL